MCPIRWGRAKRETNLCTGQTIAKKIKSTDKLSRSHFFYAAS